MTDEPKKAKVLVDYSLKVKVKFEPEYEMTDVSHGYTCACGGDDHETFADQCKCYCHG